MELEEIWSLSLPELEKKFSLSKNLTLAQARIKVSKDLYSKNKLDEKQRFIVENDMFQQIGDIVIYKAYQKMNIKFDSVYLNLCSDEQLLDFVDILTDSVIGSDAHKTAVIIKLLNDGLFKDDKLLKTRQYTAPIKIVEKKKEENKSLKDWALYIWPKSVALDEKILKNIETELNLCKQDDLEDICENVLSIISFFPKPAKSNLSNL